MFKGKISKTETFKNHTSYQDKPESTLCCKLLPPSTLDIINSKITRHHWVRMIWLKSEANGVIHESTLARLVWQMPFSCVIHSASFPNMGPLDFHKILTFKPPKLSCLSSSTARATYVSITPFTPSHDVYTHTCVWTHSHTTYNRVSGNICSRAVYRQLFVTLTNYLRKLI